MPRATAARQRGARLRARSLALSAWGRRRSSGAESVGTAEQSCACRAPGPASGQRAGCRCSAARLAVRPAASSCRVRAPSAAARSGAVGTRAGASTIALRVLRLCVAPTRVHARACAPGATPHCCVTTLISGRRAVWRIHLGARVRPSRGRRARAQPPARVSPGWWPGTAVSPHFKSPAPHQAAHAAAACKPRASPACVWWRVASSAPPTTPTLPR